MQFTMPIHETRVEMCVVSSKIKPYGSKVKICPESERKKAAFSFLKSSNNGKEK